jgi:hypothetical protein
MVETELPSGPWEAVGSDIFFFEDELYVIFIDYYSKWIEAKPVEYQTSMSVIAVMKEVFSCFGIPKVVRSDNGSCYNSKEFRNFAIAYGFESVTSSPRYPQSNGLAESAVKTVKRLWCKTGDKASALMAYRTTPLPAGYSPSELMFGRQVRSKLGAPGVRTVDYGAFEYDEKERHRLLKDKWDLKYRAHKLPDLTLGDKVWVKSPSDKGSEGTVLRRDKTPHSYWVGVGNSELRRNRKHLFLLFDTVLPNRNGAGGEVHCDQGNDVEDVEDQWDDAVEEVEANDDFVEDQLDRGEGELASSRLSPDEGIGVRNGERSPPVLPQRGGDVSHESEVEGEPFKPVETKMVRTRFGRVVKPVKKMDMWYYK